MYISKEFSKIVETKYKEMKNLGKIEDFLDKEIFGDMKVFINPQNIEISFLKFTMESGDVVYVGDN